MDPYAAPQTEPTTQDADSSSWWERPAGGREVCSVALPLVVSSLSWTVMTFVDRVLLKWESGDAMSAAFAAGTVWFSAICLPLGIAMYTNTFVSQYYGAERYERIGVAVWQGVWLSLIAAPFMLMAIPIAPSIFDLADHTSNIQRLEVTYFQILLWGAPAMIVAQALASFYSGRGKTKVVMVVDTIVALVNLALDWVLIFGKFGFPAMGIAGAGWATVIALWLKAAIYVSLLMQRHNREQFGTLRGMRWDSALFGRLVYFGGPSGMQLVLDVMGFTVFILLVGRLGATEAEATTMAFSISTLAFMPVWGMSMAASILVGQHLGEDRDDLAARATWTSLQVALAYMASISLLYLVVPRFVPRQLLRGRPLGRNPRRGSSRGGDVATICRSLQSAGCHAYGVQQRHQGCRRHTVCVVGELGDGHHDECIELGRSRAAGGRNLWLLGADHRLGVVARPDLLMAISGRCLAFDASDRAFAARP